MIKYLRTKNSTIIDNINYTTYGVEVLDNKDGDLILLDEITDVSSDKDLVQQLVDDCNKYDLDPVHLRDVIADRLYAALSE